MTSQFSFDLNASTTINKSSTIKFDTERMSGVEIKNDGIEERKCRGRDVRDDEISISCVRKVPLDVDVSENASVLRIVSGWYERDLIDQVSR